MATLTLPPASVHSVPTNKATPVVSQISNVRKRELLLDLIKSTGVANHFHWNGVDSAVKSRSLEIVKTWNLGLSDKVLEKYLEVGLVMATTAYRHTPFDAKVFIAVYTCCVTLTDDNIMTNEMISESCSRLFGGEPQLHPILTALIGCLTTARLHYSTCMTNTIAMSTVDFLSSEMFLRDEGGSDLQVPEAATFVDYLRWKTGIGEGYAAFIWPESLFPKNKSFIQTIPDAAQFICLLNDVFSFHKEDKVGETDNYVSQRTRVLHQTALETLEETVKRVIAIDARIKTILGDTPERRAWEIFAAGYTEFHLYTPRYFLKELLPEYYSRDRQ
ncbi:terpene cyclase [Steccherinum ochraceum]|uniref:Terpene cyclase n=1 Tax=Steccherinum ochraceum TaxID=92696 RepID=A0A4V2MW68_9APHY|nr:terpene cyclase [Steccherinum ochraceum]